MSKELKLQYIKVLYWIAGVIGILCCIVVACINYQLRYVGEQKLSELLIYVIGIPAFTAVLIIIFLYGTYQIIKKYL